jgi:hypothetical protein
MFPGLRDFANVLKYAQVTALVGDYQARIKYPVSSGRKYRDVYTLQCIKIPKWNVPERVVNALKNKR